MDDIHPTAIWHALTTLPWALRLLIIAVMVGCIGLCLYVGWWAAAVLRERRQRS